MFSYYIYYDTYYFYMCCLMLLLIRLPRTLSRISLIQVTHPEVTQLRYSPGTPRHKHSTAHEPRCTEGRG